MTAVPDPRDAVMAQMAGAREAALREAASICHEAANEAKDDSGTGWASAAYLNAAARDILALIPAPAVPDPRDAVMAQMAEALRKMVDFHNGPVQAKRHDVFMLRIGAQERALAAYDALVKP